MYFLTYISQVSKKFTPADLDRILKKAQVNNAKHELSGLLLESGGTFFQLLEGEKAAVLEVFQKIAKDPRHSKIEIVFEAEIKGGTRIFSNWGMGFVDKKSAPRSKQALIASLHDLARAKKPEKEKIIALLKRFSSTEPKSAREIVAQSKLARKSG